MGLDASPQSILDSWRFFFRAVAPELSKDPRGGLTLVAIIGVGNVVRNPIRLADDGREAKRQPNSVVVVVGVDGGGGGGNIHHKGNVDVDVVVVVVVAEAVDVLVDVDVDGGGGCRNILHNGGCGCGRCCRCRVCYCRMSKGCEWNGSGKRCGGGVPIDGVYAALSTVVDGNLSQVPTLGRREKT